MIIKQIVFYLFVIFTIWWTIVMVRSQISSWIYLMKTGRIRSQDSISWFMEMMTAILWTAIVAAKQYLI